MKTNVKFLTVLFHLLSDTCTSTFVLFTVLFFKLSLPLKISSHCLMESNITTICHLSFSSYLELSFFFYNKEISFLTISHCILSSMRETNSKI